MPHALTAAPDTAAAGVEAADTVATARAPDIDFSGPLQPLPEPPVAAAPVAPDLSGAERLAERLCATSFADRAVLCPDPAQAGRFALETLRAFHQVAGRPKRTRLIHCAGPYAAPLPLGLAGDAGIDTLATDDPEAIIGAITPKTAGILLAPVRADSPLEVLPGGLLAALREAADAYGIVLAYDESACGLGRTGMMWAHEWTGASPDLMIVGAGLAGPAPLSAVLTTAKVARGARRLPPVDAAALAAGHARLDRLTAPGFEAQVQARGWMLEDRLALLAHQHRAVFTGTVGLGLMQGLACVDDAAPLAAKAAAEGLLTRPLGRVLGLFPALDVSEEEIDAAAAILARIAATV
ncbi:aminotransferase class III-fold pyridoxal phosphate-dependent enzyme [Xanthobacter sp. V4C-4]|uniref:aminotransferase class III-fold pyridoxal phosphate-dependent enzyme n=1 Tax=Xanthobacter cornucopiae TaxID=3119924 RepID=UPI00372C5E79